jgi:uncharacterized protein (TIGR00290 family)
MDRPKALVSWSGGKDSALALDEIGKSGTFEVVSLLTTLTRDFDRVSMHGVRRDLLERQSMLLRLPIEKVWINAGAPNADYEAQMSRSLLRFRAEGVRHVVFGDLFLEDIRRYRERNLSSAGLVGVFPLWGMETGALARDFIKRGFKALLCCVDPRSLDPRFCGREFDESLLSEFPEGVDPCGENGEFHTFVYGGPIFDGELEVRRGEVVTREGFCFADILPV